MSGLPVKTILDAAWRRKWWVLIPPVVGLAVSVVLLERAPKVYRASTTVLVVPQRLPSDYVKTTVTSGLAERLASIQVQILGPSYLDHVVKELGVVGPDASDAEVERARGELRQNVSVDPDTRRTYFRIAVTNRNPKLAAAAANMLASLFIDQNSKLRTEQASTTLQQIERWLGDKKTQLDTIEGRLADYQRRYYGELPNQQGTTLQLINVDQQKLGQIAERLRQNDARIATLNTQLQTMDSISSAAGLPPVTADPNLQRLAQLERELAALRLRYTDDVPDVKLKRQELEDFKRMFPGLGESSGAEGGTGTESPVTAMIHTELRQLNADNLRLQKEQADLNAEVDQLKVRVRNTPLREQELAGLTRDYDNLKKEYDDLLNKKQEAERAEQIEAANQSEHFKVQDRAGVPSVPYSPQPAQLLSMGLLIGLAVGAGIAFLLEQLDQSLRTEESFRVAFPEVPLLVTIPNLTAPTKTAAPPKKRKNRRISAAV